MSGPVLRTLDLRLAPAAAGMWAGAWLALTTHWSVFAGVLAATALGGIAIQRRPGRHSHGHRSLLVGLLALGIAAGGISVATATVVRGTALQEAARIPAENLIVRIEGVVRLDPTSIAGPEWAASRARVVVDLTEVCLRGECIPSREVANVYGPADGIRAGMLIAASGRIRPADIGGEAVAELTTQSVDIRAEPRGIAFLTDSIRQSFRLVTEQLSPQGAGLVPGISIGDRRALPAELDDAMKAASLTHLTAVSGAHVAVIVGVMLGLTAMLPPRFSLALGALTLIGIYLLVGPLPSIKRAMVMGLVVLLARLRGRAPASLPALSVAVIVVTALWPHSARSYGFALSVTATAGLMLLAPVASRMLAHYLPRWLATAIAVPLTAQLACAPILAVMLAEFQTYGVLANIIATPAFVPALVCAVPAALLSPVLPAFALLLAQLSAFFTSWLATVATSVAALPYARLGIPDGIIGVAAIAIGCAACLLAIVALDRRRPDVPRRLAFAGILALALAVGWRLWPTSAPPWAMWQCDVGQGSAFLVRTAEHEALLIDTGSPGAGISTCLSNAGVHRLSHLFLSHPHADHVGGLPDVLTRVDVETITVSPATHPAHNVSATAQVAAQSGVSVSQAAVRSGQHSDASWQILGPSPALVSAGNTEANANDLSLVVLVDYDGLRVLVLGDLEIAGQESLLRTLKRTCETPGCLGVDIVVVAHHGSAKQSADLADYLAAPVAIISVGEDNDYGHPAPSAIELYAQYGDVFRTDDDGALAINRSTAGIDITKDAGS